MAKTLDDKLFDFLAQLHFNLMPPEVRARFNDYSKNNDFQGHMRHWKDNYVNGMLPDLLNPAPAGSGVVNEHQLTPDEWEKLYFAFQKTFQNMDIAKNPEIGFASEYNKATKDFIAKWFGNDKLFAKDKAIGDVEKKLTGPTVPPGNSLAEFLRANRRSLEIIFKTNNVISADFSYDSLVKGLEKKEYNTDSKFRNNLETVISYINGYGPAAGGGVGVAGYWPAGLGMVPAIDFGALPTDYKDWFEASIDYNPPRATNRIQDFQVEYSNIFSELLHSKNSKILEKFMAQADSTISKPLKAAIEQTDYANKDSKDFVPEKYPDEKNWVQELQDLKDDTYEDYFRKFTNPSRGTRIFFSPWAQNIIKAFDKEKIKPTDGIEGILSKKDAILKRLQTSATATTHFKWFTDKMEQLKNDMPKAFEGALRNGSQMRALVSALIQQAVKEGKIEEAKTAMEVLSVAKYGLLCSRTFDKLREATKDLKILSDEKLSWNKGPVKDVTTIIDKTARAALIGAAGAFTIARNAFQLSRTKIGADLSKNKILNEGHKSWNEEDTLKAARDKQTKAVETLANLATGHGPGKSGTTINDAATLAAAEAALGAMAPGTDPHKKLKKDIEAYKQAVIDQHDAPLKIREIEARQRIRTLPTNAKDDPYRQLIAYWDMLETFSMSHSFTLGSMSAKRKALLNGWDDKKSLAQENAKAYLDNYANIRTAA